LLNQDYLKDLKKGFDLTEVKLIVPIFFDYDSILMDLVSNENQIVHLNPSAIDQLMLK